MNFIYILGWSLECKGSIDTLTFVKKIHLEEFFYCFSDVVEIFDLKSEHVAFQGVMYRAKALMRLHLKLVDSK